MPMKQIHVIARMKMIPTTVTQKVLVRQPVAPKSRNR